jgi:hypothetical protein
VFFFGVLVLVACVAVCLVVVVVACTLAKRSTATSSIAEVRHDRVWRHMLAGGAAAWKERAGPCTSTKDGKAGKKKGRISGTSSKNFPTGFEWWRRLRLLGRQEFAVV